MPRLIFHYGLPFLILFVCLLLLSINMEAPNNYSVAQTKQSVIEQETINFFPIVFNDYHSATWEQVAFQNGDVTDLMIDPQNANHLFASVYLEGLFESTDGGLFWQRHEQITLTTRINDIAIHPITPTTIFLGTWAGYGVYWREQDNTIWNPIPGWAYLYPTIQTIAVHPLSPTIMFAGSANWEPVGGQIFKTNNSGQTWFPVSGMFTNALTFAFDPLLPHLIYAGTQYQGILKSTDGGDNWAFVNNGLPMSLASGADNITAIVFHPSNHEQIYLATSLGVYVTYDGAGNWQPLWQEGEAHDLVFDLNNPSTLYLGVENNILISHNEGKNWLPLDSCGIGVSNQLLITTPQQPHLFWVATNNGLWKCSTS